MEADGGGTISTPTTDLNVAPGSIVVIRDEEWLVTSAEQGSDGWLVRVRGLSELVAETTAAFYSSLDTIEPQDPKAAKVVADGSSGYRDSRLWLEALLRKTPVPYGDQALTVSTHMLADALGYQRAAVTKALDPQHIRPRILIADAVGLGKTLEIGMILSELVRRGRGERILVVTPKHVLEQMQHELWCRFALPFVRLDSAGIQKVRQKLPATRNPFTYFKRAIISIDTLKSRPLQGAPGTPAVGRGGHRRIAQPHQRRHPEQRTGPRPGPEHRGADPGLGHPAQRPGGIVRRAAAAARPDRRERPDGTSQSGRRITADPPAPPQPRRGRRGRVSDWAERAEPVHLLVGPSPAEDAIAARTVADVAPPGTGTSPYSGNDQGAVPLDPGQGIPVLAGCARRDDQAAPQQARRHRPATSDRAQALKTPRRARPPRRSHDRPASSPPSCNA